MSVLATELTEAGGNSTITTKTGHCLVCEREGSELWCLSPHVDLVLSPCPWTGGNHGCSWKSVSTQRHSLVKGQ